MTRSAIITLLVSCGAANAAMYIVSEIIQRSRHGRSLSEALEANRRTAWWANDTDEIAKGAVVRFVLGLFVLPAAVRFVVFLVKFVVWMFTGRWP